MSDRIKISIIVSLDPGNEILEIKEDFANYCEKYGDVLKVEVEPIIPEQTRMCF